MKAERKVRYSFYTEEMIEVLEGKKELDQNGKVHLIMVSLSLLIMSQEDGMMERETVSVGYKFFSTGLEMESKVLLKETLRLLEYVGQEQKFLEYQKKTEKEQGTSQETDRVLN